RAAEINKWFGLRRFETIGLKQVGFEAEKLCISQRPRLVPNSGTVNLIQVNGVEAIALDVEEFERVGLGCARLGISDIPSRREPCGFTSPVHLVIGRSFHLMDAKTSRIIGQAVKHPRAEDGKDAVSIKREEPYARLSVHVDVGSNIYLIKIAQPRHR